MRLQKYFAFKICYMMRNLILIVELIRHNYRFYDSKVEDKKLRFSRDLTEIYYVFRRYVNWLSLFLPTFEREKKLFFLIIQKCQRFQNPKVMTDRPVIVRLALVTINTIISLVCTCLTLTAYWLK